MSSKFILVRASNNGAELLATCRRLSPSLIVVTEEQLEHVPLAGLCSLIGPANVQILVLSPKADFNALEHFFRQGCSGVVPLDVNDRVLLHAIRSLFSGELWYPRRLVAQFARESFLRGPTPKLTRRESDILRLISLGHTNQEIADLCFISRETVRWHIRSLYTKLGVDDRAGAMREARFVHEATPLQASVGE